jgi:4-hydroxybenzoate polyprenyltransferase
MGHTKMKSLRSILDFFLYSNLFISLCAAAMTAESYLLSGNDINRLYVLFVFASTFALYNFQRLFYSVNASGESSSVRHHWIAENKKLLWVLTIIALSGVLLITFYFPLKFILFFLPFGLISLSYFLPFTNFRSIPFIKAMLVSLVWTCVTYYFSLLLIGLQKNNDISFAGGYEGSIRFLFLLALAVAFNIRDIGIDRSSGVNTIPVLFGERVAKIVCLVFLLACSVLVIFSDYSLKVQIGLLASVLVTAILIFNARESRSEYFYSLWIDGMIALQFLLVWAAIQM